MSHFVTSVLCAGALAVVGCRSAPEEQPLSREELAQQIDESVQRAVERTVPDAVARAIGETREPIAAEPKGIEVVRHEPTSRPQTRKPYRSPVAPKPPRDTQVAYDERAGKAKAESLTAAGGVGTQAALGRALQWLADNQKADGSWHGLGWEDKGTDKSAIDRVGVTGLALLALLGDGNSIGVGPFQDNVERAARFLAGEQQPDSGLIGDMIGHTYLYNHGIATLAICEAYAFSQDAALGEVAQNAVNTILRARNPYGAWRYDMPPIGDNDTSVTCWMVCALKAGESAGLKIDRQAYEGALSWFDETTDPATGRVGYDAMGSRSSRVMGVNEHFPPESGEGMTAAALFCRILMGQTPRNSPILEQHADLLLRKLPEWDPEGLSCDMYYWYYGTLAMRQMDGEYWDAWNDAMKAALLTTQQTEGELGGSWDPVGPWAYSGGRAYSTALMALSLEAYYRYGNLLGR